ncbi:MAG: GNAT family N-acetyltransferase [Defluviitaleaceae bacterium]|nr:GNAT family N-acetyltransferase [Defluviitaleaceae bacterium]MCL2239651.1 GNAT family N-acetyltransferase [Defluviitaleaceae bacterium]
MIEVREISPSERIHYSALCLSVFLTGRRWDVRAALADPTKSEESDDPTFPVWGAFEKGKLLSALTINPYTLRMNGHEVKMGGIGGVATLPEARGRGLVRKLMGPVFDAMREAGQVYSFLYPFSFAYYEKFGYALCYDYRQATIPIGEFSSFPYPANIAPHAPEEDFTPFAQIYEAFTRHRNLCAVRNARDWARLLNRDPYLKLQFTYLNRDPAGNPDAYVLYETGVRSHSSDNVIKVRELCWASPQGLHAIFGFFGKMSPEYRAVNWNIPQGVNLQAILPDPYAVEWAIRATGMNRIVDVNAVLAMLPAPAGSGRARIHVTDDFQPENSGHYTLEWENDILTAHKKEGFHADADLETPITTLAQLVTGYIHPREAHYRTDTKINGNLHVLSALFPKKDLYILERF